MPKQIFLLLTLAISFAKSTGAQANDWIEVRTPHFIIVSNAAEDEARNAALQFERMRAVFHKLFPDANLDTATPTEVLAIADKTNMEKLEPAAYLGQVKSYLAGLFLKSPESDYILVWLNAPDYIPMRRFITNTRILYCSARADGCPFGWARGWLSTFRPLKLPKRKSVSGRPTQATLNFSSIIHYCLWPRFSRSINTRLTTMRTRRPRSSTANHGLSLITLQVPSTRKRRAKPGAKVCAS